MHLVVMCIFINFFPARMFPNYINFSAETQIYPWLLELLSSWLFWNHRFLPFFLFFSFLDDSFIVALLRYNSHTIKFTLLKWRFKGFLVYPQSPATNTTINFQTCSSSSKDPYWPGAVAHTYNPSTLGGGSGRIAWAQEFKTNQGNIARTHLY